LPTRYTEAKTFYISAHIEEERVFFIFDDDGKGLNTIIRNPEDIFNLGYTTSNGSGIGLNHCKNIVEEMEGNISIKKSEYSGFALEISLPRRV
jgi:sensor histidine kinase regulating citrate/malate metabolism